MKLTPVVVQSYAGHKADESPRRFRMEGKWIEVEMVIDRWHQVECRDWLPADYFKVHGEDDRDYLLKHDLKSDDWFLKKR